MHVCHIKNNELQMQFLLPFSHSECNIRVGGSAPLQSGTGALINPASITSSQQLICECSNATNVIWNIPSGNPSITLSPGSSSVGPNGGTAVSEGIYTCTVNGQDELFAYVLDSKFYN